MTIDIHRTAIRMRLRGLFTAFIFSTVILVILLVEFFDETHLGISRGYLLLFFSIIYFVIIIYNYLRDYHYIYFNDDTNKILFRYYSMRPLSQTKRSIEITKESFSKYEIQESLFGIKIKIILYQKVKSGVYKYPPVSITALTSEEKTKLIQSLNRLL
jgi:hypothetical protein